MRPTLRDTTINFEEDEKVKLMTMFGTTWQSRIKIVQHAQNTQGCITC